MRATRADACQAENRAQGTSGLFQKGCTKLPGGLEIQGLLRPDVRFCKSGNPAFRVLRVWRPRLAGLGKQSTCREYVAQGRNIEEALRPGLEAR